MKKITVALLLCAAMVLGAGQALAQKVYVNGIDANFPPFAYVNTAGQPEGFDIEMMAWIAKDLGIEIKHQPMEWSGIVASLQAKKIDFIASGLSVTEERAKQIDFSTPYFITQIVLVVNNDSALTVDEILKAEKKVTVGAQLGTPEAKWLKDNQDKDGFTYRLRIYDSSPMAVEDIVNGRIVAAAMDHSPAEDAVSKRPVKILGEFGMDKEVFAIGFNKTQTEINEKINASLEKLMKTDYWKELQEKYLSDLEH